MTNSCFLMHFGTKFHFDRMIIGTLSGCRWGELESGQTTIAFTPIHQHETDELTGEVLVPESRGKRGQLEVCFDYQDVDAAYKVSYQSNFKNNGNKNLV